MSVRVGGGAYVLHSFFSSPEPKVHRSAYSIARHQSSVHSSTFSNNISEAMKPVLTIFTISRGELWLYI